MGCCGSRGRDNLSSKDARSLTEKTYFTHEELQQMWDSFHIEFPNHKITVKDLANIYKSYYPDGDPMEFAQAIFKTFDADGNGELDFREFAIGMSILNRSPIEEKLRWVFQLYDNDGNSVITRDELLSIFRTVDKMIPLQQCTPEQRAEMVFSQVDADGDDTLSVDEFIQAVINNPFVIHPIPIN